MSYFLLAAGISILIVVFLEMLWTTMGIGSGIITRYLSGGIWRLLLSIHRFRPSHLLLTWGGIAILILVFTSWIFLLWVGWGLIFLSNPESVVHAYDGSLPDFWGQLYFTGFTISTLGVGDYAPSGQIWQMLTALASLSGLFFVTFTVTYLVPIVSAVTSARETAVHISSLGLSPYEIILHNYLNDEYRDQADAHIHRIISNLMSLEQQHLTYPILHYFHIPMRPESIVLSVAMLDEALTIMTYSRKRDESFTTPTLRVARQAITEFLSTLSGSILHSSDRTPPVPSLQPLEEAGYSDVDEEAFREKVNQINRRRRRLLLLVEKEGWSWDDVYDRTGDRTGHAPLNLAESSIKAGDPPE